MLKELISLKDSLQIQNYERDIIDENDGDWNFLSAGITFQEYVNCDIDIMTSELFAIDELKTCKLSGANVIDDEEVREKIMPSSFKNIMDSRRKLNCFIKRINIIKRGFPDIHLDERDVIDENYIDGKAGDWNFLSAEITCQEYANCDTKIMTSELFATNELKACKLSSVNLIGDEEVRVKIILSSFTNIMHFPFLLREKHNFFIKGINFISLKEGFQV